MADEGTGIVRYGEGPTPLADALEAYRRDPETTGRSQKNRQPAVRGWHTEDEAARLLGEHIQTRRRNRKRGLGPKWVRHGRDVLYPDGGEDEYLADLLKKAEAERAPPRRGRPRKGGS